MTFFTILIYTTRVLFICTASFVFIRRYHICKAEMHCRDVVQNSDSTPIPGILDFWVQIPESSSFCASWRMETVGQCNTNRYLSVQTPAKIFLCCGKKTMTHLSPCGADFKTDTGSRIVEPSEQFSPWAVDGGVASRTSSPRQWWELGHPAVACWGWTLRILL